MQLAAGAIAQVFANQFERGYGIGYALFWLGSEHVEYIFVGDLRGCGGLFCGHFLSLFLGCGRRIVNFYGHCGGFGDSRFAAVEIVDTHLVTVANPFGERAAQIRVKSMRHGPLDCNAVRGGRVRGGGEEQQVPRRFASRNDKVGRGQALTGDLRCWRRWTTWSRTRWATSHFVVSGTSTTSSRLIMVTALRSESKPTPSRETSLTTIASRFFETSFWRAFSRTFSVSAAKPTMIWFPLWSESSFRMSGVASSSRLMGPLRLIFWPAAFFGR